MIKTNKPWFSFMTTTTPATTPANIGTRTLLGASILPYAIDTQHNNLYILLGAETRQARWAESGKFSDFGGRAIPGESAEACAAREFYEETCATVPMGPSTCDIPTMQHLLESNAFTFRIQLLKIQTATTRRL